MKRKQPSKAKASTARKPTAASARRNQPTQSTTRRPRRKWGRAAAANKPVTPLRDPKAPPKGAPRPSYGVGSPSAESNSQFIEVNGTRMCLGAWCRALGITRNCLRSRLARYPKEIACSPDFWEKYLELQKARGAWSGPRHFSPEAYKKKQQQIKVCHAANRAHARKYTAHGETHSLSEWSEILGIRRRTLAARLRKPGVSVATALSAEGGRALPHGKPRERRKETRRPR